MTDLALKGGHTNHLVLSYEAASKTLVFNLNGEEIYEATVDFSEVVLSHLEIGGWRRWGSNGDLIETPLDGGLTKATFSTSVESLDFPTLSEVEAISAHDLLALTAADRAGLINFETDFELVFDFAGSTPGAVLMDTGPLDRPGDQFGFGIAGDGNEIKGSLRLNGAETVFHITDLNLLDNETNRLEVISDAAADALRFVVNEEIVHEQMIKFDGFSSDVVELEGWRRLSTTGELTKAPLEGGLQQVAYTTDITYLGDGISDVFEFV